MRRFSPRRGRSVRGVSLSRHSCATSACPSPRGPSDSWLRGRSRSRRRRRRSRSRHGAVSPAATSSGGRGEFSRRAVNDEESILVVNNVARALAVRHGSGKNAGLAPATATARALSFPPPRAVCARARARTRGSGVPSLGFGQAGRVVGTAGGRCCVRLHGEGVSVSWPGDTPLLLLSSAVSYLPAKTVVCRVKLLSEYFH